MTLLDVMTGRLGIAEIPGEKNNEVILSWFKDVGHAEIHNDETSWCAVMLGSALVKCGLPIPPRGVNMLARSYMTYGVKSDPVPGAIAIWPRGTSTWQGHVNVVESVTDDGKVICIGGNQSAKKGADAVTRTKPLDPAIALDFRMPVAATVKDLRKAGSTEIKQGDRLQNAGTLMTIVTAVIAALKELLAPITKVPDVANVGDALTFWQQVIGGANAVAGLVLENPWLAGTVFAGLVCAWVGHTIKSHRVAKAAAGAPLSSEVGVA